ncbi:hypothetical protein KR074_003068, partial [Drosophila pseudoananassae]
TSDETKFNTILASIEAPVLARIADAIVNQPCTGKYENLKSCILERFCESEQRKIQQLISETDLGDKRPTQLLNELNALAANKVHESFLKTLWLQRLPTQVQAILQASDASLANLAKLADKVMEVGDSYQLRTVDAKSAPTSSAVFDDRLDRIEQQINALSSLHLILLGLRTTIKSDIGLSPAEMVYGTTLRVPGGFFAPSTQKHTESEFTEALQKTMSQLPTTKPVHHHTPQEFVHPDLHHCTHVFVRVDRVKTPLAANYEGPFEVVTKHDKYFILKGHTKDNKVSIDRLKPAYIFKDETPPTQEQTTAPTAQTPEKVSRSGRRIRFPAKYLSQLEL